MILMPFLSLLFCLSKITISDPRKLIVINHLELGFHTNALQNMSDI